MEFFYQFLFVFAILNIIIFSIYNLIKNNKKIKASQKKKKNISKNTSNRYNYKKKQYNSNNQTIDKEFNKTKKIDYVKKNNLMTNNEKFYYNIIINEFGDNYNIVPQVNLASIVDKELLNFNEYSKHFKLYRNELFRNIDFGIFTKDYELKLLIEINDRSHLINKRIERDIKVNDICNRAGIKLLTIWTNDKNKTSIIRKINNML